MDKNFAFAFVYNKDKNFFNFEYLTNSLSSLEKETSCKITCHFIEINNIENDINIITSLNMICSLPSEANYIPLILNKFPQVKWVHSLFAGVDKFLTIPKIKEDSNIILTNARGAYSEALAEYTIMSILYFNYNIPIFIQNYIDHKWQHHNAEQVNSKTICIIGYGKNGVAIAKRVKNAFNMYIIGIVRVKRDVIEGMEFCNELYGFNDMKDDVINKSDFILATLPQTKESVNLFDKKFFNKMKRTAVFINIGRGSAVVEDDLVEAINNGIIRGAVIDVTQKEPLESSSKLYDVSNEKLLITNHSGDLTCDYDKQSYQILLQNIRSYIMNDGKLETIVKKELGY